ncbi:hypothetical protein Cgig2_033833 [Carnegiea gigantea]|uniref:Small ribosomal subunit protein eS4 central region domain-containing protein n=1 Tax=Carnegiea gigantea TaxID=171969 RepID=A0A9Q1Q667_9CARY|nr:hypothetical protein Cgig2_033833 [Carnegiea gigantea]
MLDKLGGAFLSELFQIHASDVEPHFSSFLIVILFGVENAMQAPKPSSGPHKSRECLPLLLILRNRLKYALTYCEVIAILMQRHVLVDGKVRTDKTYPAGFMHVVSIPKTNENFRLLYDVKGRFRLHSLRDEEAKVRNVQFGQKGIPYLNTYDGCTIRYPDPLIKANDTIKLDLESNKIVNFIKFDVGNVVMVTGGRNRCRVGDIKNREEHKGSFETIHIQDATEHEFAIRQRLHHWQGHQTLGVPSQGQTYQIVSHLGGQEKVTKGSCSYCLKLMNPIDGRCSEVNPSFFLLSVKFWLKLLSELLFAVLVIKP